MNKYQYNYCYIKFISLSRHSSFAQNINPEYGNKTFKPKIRAFKIKLRTRQKKINKMKM